MTTYNFTRVERDGVSFVESLFPEDSFIRTWNGFEQPLVHWPVWNIVLPSVTIPLYLLVVFYLPTLIKKEYSLKTLLAVWNFFLSFGSLILLILWISPVFHDWAHYNFSFHHLVCMPGGELTIGLNMFCASLFVLSKYIELFDTVWLVLRKRPVGFLHWYHHTSVLLYCWYCGGLMIPIGNLFGVVNVSVHTIMYFYFFLTSIGLKPTWGVYVTRLQLVQMVIGLVASATWSYWHLTGQSCPLFNGSELEGKLVVLLSAILYGSYFALFLHFYLTRFPSKVVTKKGSNDKKGEAVKETKKGK